MPGLPSEEKGSEFEALILGAHKGGRLVYVRQTDFGFNGRLPEIMSRPADF